MTESPDDMKLIKFEGGRFETTEGRLGIPVDVLNELSRFAALVTAVARDQWLAEHPGRRRVPSGFNHAMQLRLVDFEGGSTVPVVEVQSDRTLRLDTDVDIRDLFDKSSARVGEAISSLDRDGSVPDDFPDDILPLLATLGRSFEPDEACRVRFNGGYSAKYSRNTRRRLRKYMAGEESTSIEGTLIGRIGGTNPNRRTFEFLDAEGKLVSGHYSQRDLFYGLKEKSQRWDEAPFVRLKCQFFSSSDDRVSEIEDVTEIETVIDKNENLGHELWELLELKPGWLDGEGKSIAISAVELARDFASELTAPELQGLDAGPTEEGGIILDQLLESRRWMMEVEPGGSFHVASLRGSDDSLHNVSSVNDAVTSYREFLES